ncbi:MAG: hypothetical protein A3E83_00325 [Gammaproteobacteria bacterium RIFCSPHIGHO2_12_FULL_41_20]|nr:MAG: hypothetical protein A3E83_00325 [Gammaproteobacteria bacterium RIFCSPHIGHO2_12_FULL_41_20]
MAQAIAHKAAVIRELKRIGKLKREFRKSTEQSDDTSVAKQQHATEASTAVLSQSECHLKVMLGDHQYRENNLRDNVAAAIDMLRLSPSKVRREEMIAHCVCLIESERAGGKERFYFYHGCDEVVGFLYQLYTTLYQLLQRDERAAAFRGSNKHFARLQTLAEFMAHYSKGGTQTLDNNEADFNEFALSANVFLFGNHATPTSNSVCYWHNNDVRRTVNLPALLTDFLRHFNVSEQDKEALIQLYEQYVKGSGGVLYQMSMPRDQVAQHAYPAGFMGVQNPYHGEMDVVTAVQTASHDLLQSSQAAKEAREYLCSLQARVFVPPHVPLAVQTVHLQADNKSIDPRLQPRMQVVVESIVQAMLSHSTGRGAALHPGLPLQSVAKSLYDEAGLDLAKEDHLASKQSLVEAIVKNEAERVIAILEQAPHLKAVKLPRSFQYIGITQQQLLTPLEMILRHSTLPGSVLERCFGKQWAQELVIDIDTPELLVAVLTRLTADDRLAFVEKCAGVIKHAYELARMLEQLDSAHRLAFAEKCAGVIKHAYELARMLEQLDSAHRLAFADKYAGVIKNGYTLARMLEQLDSVHRLAFVKMKLAVVDSDGQLDKVLALLQPTEHTAVREAYEQHHRRSSPS